MEPVRREEVVRYWLEREVDKRESGPDPSTLTTDAAVDALLREKPGAADVIWDEEPVDWYRLELSRERFERLRLIGGPPRLLWRALAPEGTVMGAARRISAEPAAELETETGVDVGTILDYRDAIADGEALDPLVVATRQGCAPWYVADGNHRATALALRLLETDDYRPQPAYLVVAPNPVIRPAYERLCGLVRRLI
jgi:hypothetical protein